MEGLPYFRPRTVAAGDPVSPSSGRSSRRETRDTVTNEKSLPCRGGGPPKVAEGVLCAAREDSLGKACLCTEFSTGDADCMIDLPSKLVLARCMGTPSTANAVPLPDKGGVDLSGAAGYAAPDASRRSFTLVAGFRELQGTPSTAFGGPLPRRGRPSLECFRCVRCSSWNGRFMFRTPSPYSRRRRPCVPVDGRSNRIGTPCSVTRV